MFFSRSKQRLWEKGETSGHTLDVVDVVADCDNDTLLVTARPHGPACHHGTLTCFGDEPAAPRPASLSWRRLEARDRAARARRKPEGSYTARLLAKGIDAGGAEGRRGRRGSRAGRRDCGTNRRWSSESADLLFHLLVLLRARGLSAGAGAIASWQRVTA